MQFELPKYLPWLSADVDVLQKVFFLIIREINVKDLLQQIWIEASIYF